MKKWLVFGGLAGIGFSFYYYFNQQLKLALNLTYKIKKLEVLSINNENATIACDIEVKNNSSFQIKIKKYSIFFSFEGNEFAETQNVTPFIIMADNSFIINTEGKVNLNSISKSILPFLNDVIKKHPINVQIDGFIEIEFMGINHTIELNKKQITYSNNLLKDVGIEKGFDKIANKIKSSLQKFGIKTKF